MGMQGPQGSGGHEAGSDAGGPSMCPEGCSGVKGIWRNRSEEEAQSREGERQRVPRQEKRDRGQGAGNRPQKQTQAGAGPEGTQKGCEGSDGEQGAPSEA